MTVLLVACFAFLATLQLGAVALGEVTTSPIDLDGNSRIVQNTFIVEISGSSKKRDTVPHRSVYQALRARGFTFQIEDEFHSPGVFNGFVVTVNDTQDVIALANVPNIENIRPVMKIARPELVDTQSIQDYVASQASYDGFSTHVMTGVDRVHAEGNTGKGIKIGIIDTGIDYTHPSLGAGIGRGFKVIGGYDFVGDAFNGENTANPDNDPLDQCAGHGTHVAGIIGADKGSFHGIRGVAYSASLSAYRVFGCAGHTRDDVIIKALLRAVSDGQDIINLSLGEALGWSESTLAVVASRIAATGKIVVASAGNDGATGAFFTSVPGTGVDVMSVGSVDNVALHYQSAKVQGGKRSTITYYSTFPLNITTPLKIHATSTDTSVVNDLCTTSIKVPADLPNLLLIVRRGECGLSKQIQNANSIGAKTVLFYDNGEGVGQIQTGLIKAALISAEDGEWLVSQFAARIAITISFPQTGASTDVPNPTGGLLSYFSSYGPANDFDFKPNFCAPGGKILSTMPVKLGSWGVQSGTSMAAPFIAGSAALLLAAKGKSPSVGKSARKLFASTARPIYSMPNAGLPLQTVAGQGAGLIQVYDAIHATSIVSRGELILNDSAHFAERQTFTISNTGKSKKTYSLTHTPAGTAVTVEPGSFINVEGPIPLNNKALSVRIEPTSFTLRPGKDQEVTVRFSLPKNNNPGEYPIYSGFITASSENEKVHVTYMGMGQVLKNREMLDFITQFSSVKIAPLTNGLVSGEMEAVAPRNYTFRDRDYLGIMYSLTFGSASIRVDLVSSNFALPKRELGFEANEGNSDGMEGAGDRGGGNQGGGDKNGGGKGGGNGKPPVFYFPRPGRGGSFSKVKTIGVMAELKYVSRHDQWGATAYTMIPFETPTFANGTRIRDGSYKLLFRVLRATGDPTKQEDYDSWMGPPFGIFAGP